MTFELVISDEAKAHLKLHRKSGQKLLLQKIDRIFDELRVTPFEGIGHPEQLRYGRSNQWSRKIDKKHWLIYQVFEQQVLVEVISAYGHYDDR